MKQPDCMSCKAKKKDKQKYMLYNLDKILVNRLMASNIHDCCKEKGNKLFSKSKGRQDKNTATKEDLQRH